jgi:hypothetical protein
LFGSLGFNRTPCVQEIFALFSFIQPRSCCPVSRPLCFQSKAAFS